MAQPKITGLASPGDIDLGDVQDENPIVEKPDTTFSLPGQDSTEAVSLDLLGMQRTIQITGYIQKSTIADLKTWREKLHTYIKGPSGFQKKDAGTEGYNYISDYLGTINVKIIYFSAPIKAGQTPETTYVLRLLECKAL